MAASPGAPASCKRPIVGHAPPCDPSPYQAMTHSQLDFTTSRLIDLALAEDVGGGDVTSSLTIPVGWQGRGTQLAKAAGVISGLDIVGEVFRRVDPAITFTTLVADGDAVVAMTPIATVEGPARSLLTTHGGACCAQPFAASLRGGHRHRALCRRGTSNGGTHSRHAQDDTGPACTGEGRSASRRRAQPPLRTD